MFIDAQNVGLVIQHLFKHTQTCFAEVTETRVVIPAFGIVVVGNDCCINPNGGQHIKSVETLNILTNFVHLIYRHRYFAES